MKMPELLKIQGFRQASLAVQKANYAVKMYEQVEISITSSYVKREK